MIRKETLRKRSFNDLRQMYDFMLRYIAGDRTEEQEREELGDAIQREISRVHPFVL